MKRFTTSAQKTLSLPKDVILKKLEDEMSKDNDLVFRDTKIESIKEAKLKDGSKLIIAAFNKENGKTLAMIDHKDLPIANIRVDIQKSLRKTLDKMFE
jgi:hypothetical protein